MRYLFIIIINIVYLNGCTNYASKSENVLIIDKINIHETYKIDSLNNFVNGIVMFEETGRPDLEASNVVIGAHSGYGSNAYFNEIYSLEKDDLIELIYNSTKYIYSVEKVDIVDKKDTYILNDTKESILTLITCKISDKDKRIVVISELINKIDIWHNVRYNVFEELRRVLYGKTNFSKFTGW